MNTATDSHPQLRTNRATMMKMGVSCLASFLFFFLLLLTPGIPGGDDGYRHVKFAHNIITNWQEIRQNGWHLVYLWPQPVDVWFLFHLLLSPLTLILPLITALKVLTALIFGLIVLMFFKLLETLGARYHWLWVLLLGAGSVAFIFRMSLGRPVILAVLLMLLATFCVIKQKKILLLLTSAAFALSYSVFFLVLVIPGVYLLAAGVKKSWRLLAIAGVGVGIGVLLNPFFPASVAFSLVQTFLPPLIGMKYDLPLGAELYSLDGWVLVNMAVIVGLWLVAGFWFLKKPELRRHEQRRFLFILSLLMLALTIKTQRSVEYFVPFALLFIAAIFTPILERVPWQQVKNDMAKRSPGHLRVLFAIPAIFVVIIVAHLIVLIKNLRAMPSPNVFRGVSDYLLQHAPADTIVFNTQWDEYPQLFFWNSKNYYLLGMDPTFMYFLNQEKYWLWHHISMGELLTCPRPRCETNMKATQSIYQTVTQDFNASYILVTNERTSRLKSYLDTSRQFESAYADEKVTLYRPL